MTKEIWLDVPNYEGYYQVSSLGRVKRLRSVVGARAGKTRIIKERLMNPTIDSLGYFCVGLSLNSKVKIIRVHQLVAIAFLNHTPKKHKLVVDHINQDKLDNSLGNLRLVTQRRNTHNSNIKTTSKYIGVSYYQGFYFVRIWNSRIKKNEYLGRFTDEIEASNVYQKRLKELESEEV
jgi:hypothetical protein